MFRHKILYSVLSVFIVASMVLGNMMNVQAQTPTPAGGNPPPIGPYHPAGKKVTEAEKAAAVKNNAALGLKPGLAGAGISPSLLMTPNDPPHYYGPFANYANSPLPKGAVATISVDDGGSGYTAAFPPVVTITDVYGTGSGALATATVVGGKVTGITINNGGVHYSAPWVSIDDVAPGSPGTGTGAVASVAIGGPFDVGTGIRKFIDALPGLTPAGANALGQYIPIAQKDTVSFPGKPAAVPPVPAAEYYEIAVVQFTEKLHSDLPATTLRGYVQLSTSVVPGAHVALNNPDGSPILLPDGTQAYGVDYPHYLGPLIISSRDVPVRIKFVNLLPTGAGGDLFIPVDTTYMGAGEGALDAAGNPCDPAMQDCAVISQNRATIHNHGHLVPWISDGTPMQWTTPAGEDTKYPKGVSTAYVPDMWFDASGNLAADCQESSTCATPGLKNNPGPGEMSFYYNNQQSARLEFYHDHAYGITRLNVYVGEVAGYLITDQVEQDLINGTNLSGVNPGLVQALPGLGTPLLIQDKTFVDETTIAGQDPTWRWGTGAIDPLTGWPAPKTGDLWVSSVYMPAQNPWDVSGTSAFGRWMYGPYFFPPTGAIANPPVANPYYDPTCNPFTTWCEPPLIPATPSPSSGMESFNDTTMVNGNAYPYLWVDPTITRFRILNGANDRFFNLSLWVADPSVVTSDLRTNTEVKMVPAVTTPGFPAAWPSDGRVGGVPDPATAGPDWIQIGTEGGFLPAPVVIPAQPVTWNLNPTTFNFGTVEGKSLLLGNAERADVLVDFSQFAGKTLILYNDAPAAFPALVPQYDYYTGDPAQMDAGGAPTTQPGYGPNTRTIMQIRVRGNATGSAVSAVNVTNGGSDYLQMPKVYFSGTPGGGAAALAYGSIDHITVLFTGQNYTSAPTVNITPPSLAGGVQAVATAQISGGRVVGILVSNRGSGYTVNPTITFTGGGGTGAQARSALTVTEIRVTNPGAGYTVPPVVTLLGGAGYDAAAVSQLVGTGPGYDVAALENVWAKGTVNANLTVNPGVFATGQDPIIVPQAAYDSAYNATFPNDMSQYVQIHDTQKDFFNGPLTGLTLTAPGAGYASAPTVTITGGGATTDATASAAISGANVNGVTVIAGGSGYSTTPPTVVFTAPATPGGVTATGTAVLSRKVASVTITGGGSGYSTPPTVVFTSATGSGAAGTAVISGGRVVSVTITNGGSGYNTAVFVTFTGGGGTGARATSNLTRYVANVLLTNSGSGYTAAPTISFVNAPGDTGSGAAAIASFMPGYVSGLTLLTGGAGYSFAPTITFNNAGTGGSGAAAVADPITIYMEPKAIHDEMGAAYDEYGRMSGFLGLELRNTINLTQNILLYGYASPPLELMSDSTFTPLGTLGDGTQIWQIIHNGVDTHPIHFHLFNVQLLNRVGWDGILLPPDANEVGWKETVRVNPLEITIVAFRPVAPTQPFDVPNSIRLIDPTMPENAVLAVPPGGFKDPAGNPVDNVLNVKVNFGWEYVWHCHILSHEEMDMMHSMAFGVAPKAPTNVTVNRTGSGNFQNGVVSWKDNSTSETGYTVQRSTTPLAGPWVTRIVLPPTPGFGTTVTWTDAQLPRLTTLYYRVIANELIGDTQVFTAPSIGFPTLSNDAAPVYAAAPITTLSQQGPIFADSFETGLDLWNGLVGDVKAEQKAVVGPNGGKLGLVATVNNGQAAYVYDTSPKNLGIYAANFSFDAHGFISNSPIDVFTGLDQNLQPTFGVQYQGLGALTYQLRAWVMQQGEPVYTGWSVFTTDEPEDVLSTTHRIDLAWMSGTNGGLSLWIDNSQTNLRGDTSASKIAEVLLGPAMGMDSTASGSMYFDEFASSIINGVENNLSIYLPMILK